MPRQFHIVIHYTNGDNSEIFWNTDATIEIIQAPTISSFDQASTVNEIWRTLANYSKRFEVDSIKCVKVP